MTSLAATTTAIEINGNGGPEVLRLTERPMPVPGAGEVLIAVAAAGVNRPDVLQRLGEYPPPPGASDIPGLEVAGRVAAIGLGVGRLEVGDAVCALVTGGGYAAYCVAPEPQCLPRAQGLQHGRGGGAARRLSSPFGTIFSSAAGSSRAKAC